MTRSLFIIATICIFFSCKKHSVDPEPQTPTTSAPINYLPKMVISSSTNSSGRTLTTFTYYPDSLVKTISKFNMDLWPSTKDSTIFSYDANKRVINKKLYANNLLVAETDITYTPLQRIDRVTIQYVGSKTEYEYHYKSSLDLDYVFTYENGNTQAKYFVTADGNLFTNYVYMVNDVPNSTGGNGFVVTGTEYHYASTNGVHEQIPTCLNLSIGFQTELAESFLEMGETNFPYRNYFYIASPRQYCSSVNARNFTYTFDTYNRLTTIHEEITNSVTPGPGPVLLPGEATSQIYY